MASPAPVVNFVFLCLKEHPYAREMLAQLISHGHVPSLIIEETSAVADTERQKFLDRIAGFDVAATITDQLAALQQAVVRVEVSNHNNADSETAIRSAAPDYIVLGGTRIIKDNILRLPSRSVLNAHPGLLPDCRGSASPAWSVFHDIKVGSTVHVCEPGIDTGPIIRREEYAVKRGDTYQKLCYETLCLSGRLMKLVVTELRDTGSFKSYPQPAGDWVTYKNAPQEVLDVVDQKLRDLTYKHYAD